LAARRWRERGRGAGLPRALGLADAGVGRAHAPLLRRGDVADLRDDLSRRTGALPLVRGGRARAVPPSADRAGAGTRPRRGPELVANRRSYQDGSSAKDL